MRGCYRSNFHLQLRNSWSNTTQNYRRTATRFLCSTVIVLTIPWMRWYNASLWKIILVLHSILWHLESTLMNEYRNHHQQVVWLPDDDEDDDDHHDNDDGHNRYTRILCISTYQNTYQIHLSTLTLQDRRLGLSLPGLNNVKCLFCICNCIRLLASTNDPCFL